MKNETHFYSTANGWTYSGAERVWPTYGAMHAAWIERQMAQTRRSAQVVDLPDLSKVPEIHVTIPEKDWEQKRAHNKVELAVENKPVGSMGDILGLGVGAMVTLASAGTSALDQPLTEAEQKIVDDHLDEEYAREGAVCKSPEMIAAQAARPEVNHYGCCEVCEDPATCRFCHLAGVERDDWVAAGRPEHWDRSEAKPSV